MSDAAPAIAIAVLCLVVVGGPLAFALTRSVASGLILSPLIAGITFTGGAVTAIVFRSALVPSLVVWIAASFLLAYRVWGRGKVLIPLAVPTVALVAIVVLSLAPLAYMFRAPVGWDARSIWWFHAEWIEEGGTGFVDAVGNDALAIHADYPPLASATVAGVRALTPEADPSRVAQATTAVLSWTVLVLVAVVVCALFRSGPALVNGVICGGVVLGFSNFVTGDLGGFASGYVDYLWAALVAVAAVTLLVQRPDRGAALLGSICLLAAGLTKNEALVCATIVAVLALIRHRRSLRWYWPVVAALVPGILWTVLVRALGASSDLGEEGNLGGLVAGESEVWSRLRPTLEAIRDLDYSVGFATLLAVALLTALVATTALVPARRKLQLGSDVWLWLLVAGALGALIAAYLVSPHDVAWHLMTSLNRTLLAPALLALVSLATWFNVALETLSGRSPRAADPSASPRQPEAVP